MASVLHIVSRQIILTPELGTVPFFVLFWSHNLYSVIRWQIILTPELGKTPLFTLFWLHWILLWWRFSCYTILITLNLVVHCCSPLFTILITLNLALVTFQLLQNDWVRYNDRANLIFLQSLNPTLSLSACFLFPPFVSLADDFSIFSFYLWVPPLIIFLVPSIKHLPENLSYLYVNAV